VISLIVMSGIFTLDTRFIELFIAIQMDTNRHVSCLII